jgi:DNA polymerase elongation subunit (family B)
MEDSLPTPLTDDRFPFLRYREANPNAKNKEADDYKAKIVSNDSEINIFDVPDNSFLKDAKLDLNEIQPFVEYSKGVAVFDLEWIGEDGGEAKSDGTDVIVAIGIKNRGEYHIGCRKDRTEKQLLEWFYKQLTALKHVHTLAAHAGYGFFRNGKQVLVDFGMIWKRSQVHGLEKLCPWKPATGKWSTHVWRNAIINGSPLEVPAWDCRKYQLIDTYPQTALYDFLINKLTDYSLKLAPVQFGIKDADERQYDIGADVYKYWAAGDTETIVSYLKEDLDDTELLWNYLLPQKYFMKSYMDWDLKRITTTGTGSWWLTYYKKQTESEIPRIDKCGYTGALTYYISGIRRNCCKYDYSGLYPSIMLTYLISMKWDKDYFLLKALKFLITYRKSIKKTQAFIDYDNGIETPEGIDAYGQQLTAKILANSLYGALALVDPYAAAAVTAYGRQLIRFAIEWLESKGLAVWGVDTDGCIVNFKEDNFTSDEERSAEFKRLEGELNAVLPGETKVEYEEYIPMVYIPPNDDKKALQILADKLNSMECYEVDPSNLDPGLSKNYIYFVKKGDKFKKVYKGKFKKRGKSWLQAGFVMDFVEKMFYEGDEAAKDFAKEIRDAIAEGRLDTKKVRETKLVSKSQKALPMYGFENSQKYTLHHTFAGEIVKRRHEWKLIMPTDDETKPYDPDYYWEEFNEKILPQLFIDLPPILEEDENGDLIEKKPMRTELSKDPETVERLLIKNGLF